MNGETKLKRYESALQTIIYEARIWKDHLADCKKLDVEIDEAKLAVERAFLLSAYKAGAALGFSEQQVRGIVKSNLPWACHFRGVGRKRSDNKKRGRKIAGMKTKRKECGLCGAPIEGGTVCEECFRARLGDDKICEKWGSAFPGEKCPICFQEKTPDPEISS
jgi:hypothetical protein